MKGVSVSPEDKIFKLSVKEGDREKFEHCSYYRIITQSKGFWGFYQRLRQSLQAIDLTIVDFRTGRKRVHEESIVQVAMYVQDMKKYEDSTDRRTTITSALISVLRDPDAKVSVQDYAPTIETVHAAAHKHNELYLAQGFRTDQKILADATAGIASVQMLKDGVNALLVVDDEDMVLGLVSQGDILRKFTSEEFVHADSLEVHTFMIKAKFLIRAPKAHSRLQMLNLMNKKDIRQILVIDDHGDVDSLADCKELLAGLTAETDRFQVRLTRPYTKRLSNLFTPAAHMRQEA